jgi:hypothetical protein
LLRCDLLVGDLVSSEKLATGDVERARYYRGAHGLHLARDEAQVVN